jgi:hypothetical protein
VITVPEYDLPRPPDTGCDARFDTSVPHPARVYNYWLGGHFL